MRTVEDRSGFCHGAGAAVSTARPAVRIESGTAGIRSSRGKLGNDVVTLADVDLVRSLPREGRMRVPSRSLIIVTSTCQYSLALVARNTCFGLAG
jgi:hypothetical protein